MTNEVSVMGEALTWQERWKEGAMGSKWGLWLCQSTRPLVVAAETRIGWTQSCEVREI